MLDFIIFYSVMFFGLICIFTIIFGSFALIHGIEKLEDLDRS